MTRSTSRRYVLGSMLSLLTVCALVGCSSSHPTTAANGGGGAGTTGGAASTDTAVTKKKPVKPSAGTAKFCADAKVVAGINAQELADIKDNPAGATTPGYRHAYYGALIDALGPVVVDAPAASKATFTEFHAATSTLASVLAQWGWAIPPSDPAGRTAVQAAFDTWSPVALKDIPLMQAAGKSACNLDLGFSATP